MCLIGNVIVGFERSARQSCALSIVLASSEVVGPGPRFWVWGVGSIGRSPSGYIRYCTKQYYIKYIQERYLCISTHKLVLLLWTVSRATEWEIVLRSPLGRPAPGV